MLKTTRSWTRSAALLMLASLVCIASSSIARGQASQTSTPPTASAPEAEPTEVTLSGEDLRRQNEINSRVPGLTHRVDSLERENDAITESADACERSRQAEASRAEKAEERATLTEAQLTDSRAQTAAVTKALAAEKRRGFFGKITAVIKTAPLAAGIGAAAMAIVLLAGGG